MLYDDTGQAIYLFDVETTTEPQCYDDCAAAWPPVLTAVKKTTACCCADGTAVPDTRAGPEWARAGPEHLRTTRAPRSPSVAHAVATVLLQRAASRGQRA